MRQNKGSILKASVEYIRKLKIDQERKIFLEEKCKLQEYQNKKLLLKLQVGYIFPMAAILLFTTTVSFFYPPFRIIVSWGSFKAVGIGDFQAVF